MSDLFDRERLKQAFTALGADLERRGVFIELAVYGGSAIILQFEWRRSTSDVDAVVREGYEEQLLPPSVSAVAQSLGLDANWLNNVVGMFTPSTEDDTLFQLAGHYPEHGTPGLRILVARPHYLLAMKLQALRSFERGDRIANAQGLHAPYVFVHDEEPPVEARGRFPVVTPQP